MQTMTYTARTLTGKVVNGKSTAKNEQALRVSLSAKGLEPLEIAVSDVDVSSSSVLSTQVSNPFDRVKRSDLRWMTGQIALMLGAGTTIAEALEALADQMKGKKLATILHQVFISVNGGSTLSTAFSEHPKVFTNFYVSAVRSGETSGDLEDVFLRLEEHIKKREQISTRIVTALIYPIVLMLIGSVAILVMMTYVIPKFVVVFANFGAELPLATRTLMATASFMQAYWYLLALGLAGAVAGVVATFRNPGTKALIDGYVLGIPVVGGLVRSIQASALLRTLGMLLNAGIPLVDSMQVAQESCSNSQYKTTVQNIAQGIIQGEGFSKNFCKSDLFDPTAKQMISTGEKTGTLAMVMSRLADHLDEDIDKRFSRLSALAEPAIIVVMGVLIGCMAIALLSPLFQLTSAVRGG